MLTTNQKGAIAEAAIAAEAIGLGIGVYKPVADERSDFIFDLHPRLIRVQCKWAVRQGDVVVIRTRRCRRARAGLVHRSYTAEEIDVIAAYCEDTGDCYLLPPELSVDRVAVQLRLEPPRNNQVRGIKWARDYELRATLGRLLGP
ncbi:MAG TPA: group I intron-associated PD-(D/E)XK endonuclease [Gaiellaceae bacterium]|nr:group I intron-associated PD-(D/E)XK endonuclease [Gaiellaceae bacterium]